MARSHTGKSPVKALRLTEDELADAKLAADHETEGVLSELGRDIIYSFLEHGSDYVTPSTMTMQIRIDPADVKRAEERARTGYGTSLGAIMRHEIKKRAVRARRRRR